ncbi:EamA family transporter RarD [Sedimentimonas flavescens]|uniref:EamA family transporter RarD n=1 Tax=Sedimentimonas flavescens TaxID=2851012 RepID=UPI001C4A342B|nr:EamA family transporter RarD [Sedimentimonas flavescens]MBW0157412.1 EamA family transporter RarD [Sedimentimonas flavescens]
MRDQVKGFWALLFACVVWGLSGLYYKQLAAVPPLEVLAHRTLWSLVFFGAVLTMQGRLRAVGLALRGRNLLILLLSAIMISTNWFGFIWSVQNGRALEASLGYYIFPLVAVGLGVVVMREAMTRAQALAVMIAASAVLYLTWGIGAPPWMALMLAGTFGAYGLIKKRLDVGPVVSVTAEVFLLAPLALALLLGLHYGWAGAAPGSGAFGSDWGTSLLLAFSGVLTGGPLILFSYAARRVRMATLGLVQYLNPTLQLSVAVIAFHEPITQWHAVALPMIWLALAIYSLTLLRRG